MSIQWWRDEMKTTFDLFAKLKADNRTLDVEYGIVGGAILWPIRDIEAHSNDLVQVCDDTDSEPIRERLRTWQSLEFTPKQAAKHLSREAKDDGDLRAVLDALLLFFREDILDYGMLQPAKVDIRTGNISGGNIVIGGSQYVAGDLIIRYLVKENVRACPTAPNPPKHFTGRDDQLTALREQLTGEDIVAITAVHAMGGMGKTTLAQALCHLSDDLFPTVLWAEITQNPDARSHLTTWGSYARDDYQLPPDTPLEQIADYVRAQLTKLINEECGRPVLVVFDDVWENGYETVELLRRAAPDGAQVLITTRHDNVVQRFQAKSLTLYELSDDEAVALLNKLRDSRFITDAHIERAASLIKGHPLALELAAASLNQAEDADDIEYILDEYERGIQDGSPFDAMDIGADRPRSLNVVFERSYAQLSDEHQRCFRALGVLAPDASWERPLAGAIWNIEDEREQIDVHKALRTAALIQRDDEVTEHSTGTWYSQHLLLRAYARALLEDAAEIDDAFRCYAKRVTHVASQFPELPLEKWRMLEDHRSHIHHVGDTLADHVLVDNPAADWLTLAGNFSWNTSHYLSNRPAYLFTTDEAGQSQPTRIRWLEMGLRKWQMNDDKASEAITLNNIGRVYSALGNKQRALSYYEQALSIQSEEDDKSREAIALNNIGSVYDDLGNRQRALSYYEQALSIQSEEDDRSRKAITLDNIGRVYSALGDKQQALSYHKQALSIQSEEDDKLRKAITLNNIGSVYDDLGDKHQALSYYEQSLPLQRKIGNKVGEAITLNNIGRVHDDLGDKHKALSYYEQSLPLQQQTGNKVGKAITLHNIGSVHDNLGDKHQALSYYEQSLPLQQQTDNKVGEAITLHNIGNVYSHLSDNQQALKYARQALPLRQKVEDKYGEMLSQQLAGLSCCMLGQIDDATAHINRVVELQPDNEVSLFWRAHINLHLKKYHEAISDFQGNMKTETPNALTRVYRSIWLGVTYLLDENLDKAQLHLGRTELFLRSLEEYDFIRTQSLLYIAIGNFSSAIAGYKQLLQMEELKQNPFSPRFYLFQLASLFPEHSEYRELYDWFAFEIKQLYTSKGDDA